MEQPDSHDSDLSDHDGSQSDQSAPEGAYLVLRSAGRWSDIFRLSPPNQAVVGRASSNQIVIRSDRASRRHASVAWSDGRWQVQDLGSRNGTFVNGNLISDTVVLSDGDIIEVAGFAITFMRRIDGGIGTTTSATTNSQNTDDQATMEIDAQSITDRRQRSDYLHGLPVGAAGETSRKLLQLSFALARCDDLASAVEQILGSLSDQIAFDTAGVYLVTSKNGTKSVVDIPLVETRQTGTHSYRRPPESLLAVIGADDGQAVLARNVMGDGQVASRDSRDEITVESVIVAPIRDHAGRLQGFIHLTTSEGQPALSPSDLEVVVAVCEILAESVANIVSRRQLDRSLRRSRRKVEQLQERLGDKVRIIGSSPAVSQVIEQISLAAPTNATILVRGESGVGKELVASALHHSSTRKDGPLICLNCAALSETLLESELFGHEKGAFTGATERKHGKFELAHGGTLMLDEIGEMSGSIQAKFLRVLEGHSFERVGGHQSIRTDVRVVAATNRDLQAMVAAGDFRQDLYYRLHVVEIVVPPLRERGKDALLLAQFFVEEFNREMGRRISGLTDAAKKRVLAYHWPGNIRELRNVIERAVVLNTGTVIDADDLVVTPAAEAAAPSESLVDPEQTLAELERWHIERVLKHTGGNKSRAASILGIERSTLDRKLKRYAN